MLENPRQAIGVLVVGRRVHQVPVRVDSHGRAPDANRVSECRPPQRVVAEARVEASPFEDQRQVLTGEHDLGPLVRAAAPGTDIDRPVAIRNQRRLAVLQRCVDVAVGDVAGAGRILEPEAAVERRQHARAKRRRHLAGGIGRVRGLVAAGIERDR